MADEPAGSATDELSEQQKRENVLRLAFNGDTRRYREFCAVIRSAVPAGTRVVLRGSAVTGERWKDGAPFDAHGPGTSDLDVTLIGNEATQLFKLTGYFVPVIHSRPLSDKDPDIAPDLVPLRDRLIEMAGRPVNIQATQEFVMTLRGDVFGQPYLELDDVAAEDER